MANHTAALLRNIGDTLRFQRGVVTQEQRDQAKDLADRLAVYRVNRRVPNAVLDCLVDDCRAFLVDIGRMGDTEGDRT